MTNYMEQGTYRRLKTRLTRAINSKDSRKVLAEVQQFKDYCERGNLCMPDDWHRWQIAADDAVYTLRRNGESVERIEL